MLFFEIEEQDVTYEDITEWVEDIPGGMHIDKGEVVESYMDVAKEIIWNAIEDSEEEFTEEEEQEIMDENIDEIMLELAQPLLEGIHEELELMLDNISSAITEINY